VPALPRVDRPITDGVVTLRESTMNDIPILVECLNDPEIARWTRVPSPYTRDHAEAYLTEMETRRRAGLEIALLTTDAATGELLGTQNLRVSWEHRRAEVAGSVFPHARGRGVSTRGSRALSRYAFERLGIARVEALLEPGNRASEIASERAGFRREATLRSYVERDGERLDMVIYSLLPEDL
jgi:RimJ/RimL family protein N-acetyltransferase